MTLLCSFTALGTSGPTLAPSREHRVLAAALPTTSVSALVLFTVMQHPRAPQGGGPGGLVGAEQALFPLGFQAVSASTSLGERMLD